MKKPLSLLLVTGIIVLTTITGFASDDRRDQDDALRLKESGDILSLEQILPRARAVHPGKVIETELERKGKRYIYELEILDQEGKVWEMKYDAHTGELLKDKRDD